MRWIARLCLSIINQSPTVGRPSGPSATGTLDQVAREVIKAEEIVDYTSRENVGLRLAKRFGASMGEGMFLAARAAGVQLK